MYSIVFTLYFEFKELEGLAEVALELFKERLEGKSFAVRCKRGGDHDFTSVDVEKLVGSVLNQNTQSKGVDLNNPDITLKLEIRDQSVFIVD